MDGYRGGGEAGRGDKKKINQPANQPKNKHGGWSSYSKKRRRSEEGKLFSTFNSKKYLKMSNINEFCRLKL